MTKPELRLAIYKALVPFKHVLLVDEDGNFLLSHEGDFNYDVRLLRELGSGRDAFGAVAISEKAIQSGDISDFLNRLKTEATRLENLE